MLTQIPTRSSAGCAGSSFPRPAALRPGWSLPADDQAARAPAAAVATAGCAACAAAGFRCGHGESGIALDRRAYCLRKRVEHETDCYVVSLSSRTIGYKGAYGSAPAGAVLSGSGRPLGPDLAVFHQHLPVLAAGPPVPLHRAQRGDQHGPGLRNWMRAREAMLAARCSRAPRRHGAAAVARPAVTRPASTSPGTAAPRRPLAPARDADDDPRAVGETAINEAGAPSTTSAPA